MYGSFYCGTADLYTYFYKTGLDILTSHGLLCYIAPNKFMRAGYAKIPVNSSPPAQPRS